MQTRKPGDLLCTVEAENASEESNLSECNAYCLGAGKPALPGGLFVPLPWPRPSFALLWTMLFFGTAWSNLFGSGGAAWVPRPSG